MAERYNTPAEGTLDWHVPLNENFNKLDRHVEIRDAEDNLSQYEPTAGSKFLATDTGIVYLGDGDQWNDIGSIAGSSSTPTSTTDDGVMIAPPGNVQSVIDDAATGSTFGKRPTQVVKLVSGERYSISDTIKVRNGVRLECNGALVEPDSNVDLFHLYRDSQLIDPHVDTRNKSWDSAAIVVGAPDAGKLEVNNRATVENAYLMGDMKGVGLQFLGGPDGGPCSMQFATGTIEEFDRGVEFYAAGDDVTGQGDWSNGNNFRGTIRQSRICVNMRSDGASVGGNTMWAQIQPGDETEWVWYMEDDPRSEDQRGDSHYKKGGNVLMLQPWDVGKVTNEYYSSGDRRSPVWYLGKGKNYPNAMVDMSGLLSNEFIINNSDYPNRNGILTAHGGAVTGTTQFSCDPSYQRNDSRDWHPESVN